MCGIYGHLAFREDVDSRVLQAMGRALKHRGPDDEGEMVLHQGEWSVGLGHKRLSIIDLSPAGRQPMPNDDETIWITFNGEIYDYAELKEELEDKGHRFRSDTDTEVIVHHDSYSVKEKIGRNAKIYPPPSSNFARLAVQSMGFSPKS